MLTSNHPYDVLVVGGGNAALCAATTARRAGASVLLLECASKDFRGGNSRHTRDIRYMHRAATGYVTGAYDEEEFWQDLRGVTGGATNERLARLIIRESENLGEWLPANGVRWQKPLAGTLHLSRSNLFMLGGGKAMMNAHYDTAAKLGVQICYETEVQELGLRDGEFISALAINAGQARTVQAKAIVVAAGGFEANISWLKEYWGE
ncbi:MAG TPA: FAD-dependent oxidoreductase, partial [Candidatus Binatus sp.]|nr:FAD-dependent oxidoreductase [Candidatus Binatus sp.]